jgi:hypothetical protein
MLPAKTRNFTFLCYVFLALALTDVAQATSHAQVLRRDHSDLNRMIRKRGSVERGLLAIGAASNPPSASAFGPTVSTTSQPPALGLSMSTDSSSTTSFVSSIPIQIHCIHTFPADWFIARFRKSVKPQLFEFIVVKFERFELITVIIIICSDNFVVLFYTFNSF